MRRLAVGFVVGYLIAELLLVPSIMVASGTSENYSAALAARWSQTSFVESVNEILTEGLSYASLTTHWLSQFFGRHLF